MKTQSHTPGPWDIFPNATKQEITIGNAHTHAPLVEASAVVPGLDHSAWANARLIAAAPELLAACEQSLITLDPMDNDHAELYRSLRAAIAKAKGEGR